MKPLYIFDLDGTLALIDHRRSILDNKDNPHRWDDFYEACVDDKPNLPVIEIFDSLYVAMMDKEEGRYEADFMIFSGRSESVREQTLQWLLHNTVLVEDNFDDRGCARDVLLRMRPVGHYTPDEELKRQWYEELSQGDKDRLVCVFDDRQKVVDMWRSLGLTCLQVAKGDF